MVGLSVVLEGSKDGITKQRTHQVISKSSMIKPSSPSSPSSSPSPFTKMKNPFANLSSSPYYNNNSSGGSAALAKSGFLDHCFLCKQKLLPGKDIYMYKGDRAFCSEECRCRQIFMDDEEINMKPKTEYCFLAASSSSPSSRKGPKNRANGFA